MKTSLDATDYHNAHMDTPFGMARRGSSPSDAMTIAGCHLKSWEKEGGWPKLYGILVKYKTDPPLAWTDAEIVVRSKKMGDEGEALIVWTGTVEEYHAMWDCD